MATGESIRQRLEDEEQGLAEARELAEELRVSVDQPSDVDPDEFEASVVAEFGDRPLTVLERASR